MRYSRFRQSILGHEPQRRNRNPNKSKITKSKKDAKGKKEKDEQQIKPDPNAALDARQQDLKNEPHQAKNSALVKTESGQPESDARLSGINLPSMPIDDAHVHFQNRLLTPCSDTDIFGPTSHVFTTSPVSDLHQDQPFDYTGTTDQCAGHGSGTWHTSPPYSSYLHQYDMEGYSASPAFCSGHQQSPHTENFGIDPSAMMVPDPSHVPVKHEEWDTRFHP